MFYRNKGGFLSLIVLPLLLPDARSKADANKVIYFTEVNLNALLFVHCIDLSKIDLYLVNIVLYLKKYQQS